MMTMAIDIGFHLLWSDGVGDAVVGHWRGGFRYISNAYRLTLYISNAFTVCLCLKRDMITSAVSETQRVAHWMTVPEWIRTAPSRNVTNGVSKMDSLILPFKTAAVQIRDSVFAGTV